MYINLVTLLKSKGVIFEPGLNESEIAAVESRYKIHFPKEWKEFYSIALPVSKGFYNWRDVSEENLEFIKQVVAQPSKGLMNHLDDIDWCNEWGKEPTNLKQRREDLMDRIKNAPKLIPLYAHRYIADIEVKNTPVFSIHGTDIIYYGENIESYYQYEFHIKKDELFDISNITHIPFWSDIL